MPIPDPGFRIPDSIPVSRSHAGGDRRIPEDHELRATAGQGNDDGRSVPGPGRDGPDNGAMIRATPEWAHAHSYRNDAPMARRHDKLPANNAAWVRTRGDGLGTGAVGLGDPRGTLGDPVIYERNPPNVPPPIVIRWPQQPFTRLRISGCFVGRTESRLRLLPGTPISLTD